MCKGSVFARSMWLRIVPLLGDLDELINPFLPVWLSDLSKLQSANAPDRDEWINMSATHKILLRKSNSSE